jgi:hypothetical protein
VLPAHQYVFDDLEGRLDELTLHHDVRMQEMLDALADGPATAYEIAGAVTWATGTFREFNPWLRRAAVGETLSHLRHLVNTGRVRVTSDDGLTTFSIL